MITRKSRLACCHPEDPYGGKVAASGKSEGLQFPMRERVGGIGVSPHIQ